MRGCGKQCTKSIPVVGGGCRSNTEWCFPSLFEEVSFCIKSSIFNKLNRQQLLSVQVKWFEFCYIFQVKLDFRNGRKNVGNLKTYLWTEMNYMFTCMIYIFLLRKIWYIGVKLSLSRNLLKKYFYLFKDKNNTLETTSWAIYILSTWVFAETFFLFSTLTRQVSIAPFVFFFYKIFFA